MPRLAAFDGVRDQKRQDIIVKMLKVPEGLQDVRDISVSQVCLGKGGESWLLQSLGLLARLAILLERGEFPLVPAEKLAE